MKLKILLTILYLGTLTGYILAQTPGFNYQAVLRDKEGTPMPNAQVTLLISLTKGPAGQVLYKESQTLTANDLGILNTSIGSGTVESGQFGDIIGVQNLNVRIEADLPEEPDIVDFGYTPLGATHFALYGEDADADPKNEMQELRLEGDSLILSYSEGLSINDINAWKKTELGFDLDLGKSSRKAENLAAHFIKGEGLTYTDPGSSDDAQSTYGKMGIKLSKPSINFNLTLDSEGIDMSEEEDEDLSDIYPDGWHARFCPRSMRFKIVSGPAPEDKKEVEYGPGGILYRVHGGGELTLIEVKDENEEEPKYSSTYTNGHVFHEFDCDGKVIFGPCFLGAEKATSKIESGVDDEEGDNKARSNQKAIPYQNLLVDETFGAGVTVLSNDDMFGGTFSTANNQNPTTLSGAFPGTDPTNGFQIVFNGQDFGTVNTVNSESAGAATVFGANGQQNATMSTFAGTPNHGMVAVYGEDGVTPKAYIRSTATVSEVAANVFTTLAAAPNRSGSPMAFAAPMGGEAAAYDRGTAQLVNGEATVTCPDHFRWVADEASMTVTITPLSAESKGVAVVEKSNGGFRVKELNGGKGNYSFDYLVMCKRKDQKDFQVMPQSPEIIADPSQDMLKHLPKGPLKSIQDLYKQR